MSAARGERQAVRLLKANSIHLMRVRYGFLKRSLIVGFFAIGGLTVPADHAADLPPLLPIALIVLVVSPVQAYWMLRESLRKKPDKNWSTPTWRTDPFTGPAQFLHAAAWSFIAFGVMAWITAARRGGDFVFPALALPFGIGLVAGSALFFRRRNLAIRSRTEQVNMVQRGSSSHPN